MKSLFRPFYYINQDIESNLWNSSDTLFVFDANVVLSLYRYQESTRIDMFSLLDNIKNNIWLPYYAALEFQRNRIKVIAQERSELNKVINNIKINLRSDNTLFEKISSKHSSVEQLFQEAENHIDIIVNNLKESVNQIHQNLPRVNSELDVIREKVENIFDTKIGTLPTNEWLESLYKEGDTRYKNKIPPGYEDKSKEDEVDSDFTFQSRLFQRKYGDLIIWKEILEKVERSDLKYLVFVTDDLKDDWVHKIKSSGNKIIGPRVELLDEVYTKSGIDKFVIYSSSVFVEKGKEYRGIDISSESIQDVEEHSKFNSKNIENELSLILREIDSVNSHLDFYNNECLVIQTNIDMYNKLISSSLDEGNYSEKTFEAAITLENLKDRLKEIEFLIQEQNEKLDFLSGHRNKLMTLNNKKFKSFKSFVNQNISKSLGLD